MLSRPGRQLLAGAFKTFPFGAPPKAQRGRASGPAAAGRKPDPGVPGRRKPAAPAGPSCNCGGGLRRGLRLAGRTIPRQSCRPVLPASPGRIGRIGRGHWQNTSAKGNPGGQAGRDPGPSHCRGEAGNMARRQFDRRHIPPRGPVSRLCRSFGRSDASTGNTQHAAVSVSPRALRPATGGAETERPAPAGDSARAAAIVACGAQRPPTAAAAPERSH